MKTEDSWKEQAVGLAEKGISWRAVAIALNKPKTTVSDFLKKHYDRPTMEMLKETGTSKVRGLTKGDNSRILLISDLHVPYNHIDSLCFLQHLKDKYSPTRIICLGDEVDMHALSYHDSDPDLPSAGDELRRSLPIIKKLENMFPQMDILDSNHGSLVWRKAKTNGIPTAYIKSYNDVLEVGEGWKWSFDLTIELPTGQRCYFHHGKSADVVKLSQQMGMCAVQGHYHEKFKIDYWANPNGLFWGFQIGCLIDDKSLAFSYNNCNIKRPMIGTGMIIDGYPILEPMVLNDNGRWIGK